MKPSSVTQAWTIATVPYSGPDAFRLTRALYEEQLSTYGFADSPADTPAREYDPPHGAFFVASVGGGPAIACGGWRSAGRDTAEFKRLYAVPAVRQQGVARCLMETLEEDAARHGKTRPILETGARNHAALALFAACGFEFIESYVEGRNPEINRAMAKSILPAAESGQVQGAARAVDWGSPAGLLVGRVRGPRPQEPGQ
jgi:GNAT superfamily N-acetyltransferase